MRHSVRRFGPVLLWQLSTLMLWLAAFAIAAPLRQSLDRMLPQPLGVLLVLLLVIGVPAFLQEFLRGLLARSWNGRPPAIAADFTRLTGTLMPAIPVVASSTINTSFRAGFLYAASIFTILFIAFAACTWAAWAWGYLRPADGEETRELPRGVEAAGLRFIADGVGDGADERGFRVIADDPATMRSVVAAFIGAQLLPGLPGGSRNWSVSVGERPIAVGTQTWEHPRWWPPIEWSADPDEPFPEGGFLRLEVASGTPA